MKNMMRRRWAVACLLVFLWAYRKTSEVWMLFVGTSHAARRRHPMSVKAYEEVLGCQMILAVGLLLGPEWARRFRAAYRYIAQHTPNFHISVAVTSPQPGPLLLLNRK